MDEEMNLTEDTNLEDGFDGLFHEEPDGQDTNARDEDGVKTEAEPEAPSEEEPKYKVNFLGEEKELPVSELITAAQKGMNYDHVKSELDGLREKSGQYEEARRLVEQMAEASGMTVEQYTQFCAQSLKDSRLKAQLDRGVPEDVARRLMELEEKENLRSAEEERRRAELERQEAYAELVREYPDIKTLPDEVAQAVAAGERPLSAYRSYENRRLKNELAALRKAEENKLKSTGSLQGDAPEEADDFLMGFNSI